MMMQYAVIKTGGKQYRVSPGDVIEVERLTVDAGDVIEFPEVLLVNNDGETHFGLPHVTDALVSGKILEHKRGKKIRVSTFKSKVRYRRVRGHRQEISQVLIESFSLKGTKIMMQKETKNENEPHESVTSSQSIEPVSKIKTKAKTSAKNIAKKS